MQSISTLLLCCIRSELCAISLTDLLTDDELASLVSPETVRALCAAASTQDLAHFVSASLCRIRSRLSEEVFTSLKKIQIGTAFRNEQIIQEIQSVSALFEESGIRHILLKGAFIRPFYPVPHMRTSCDVDILVAPEDLDAAESALCQKLQYTKIRVEKYDVLYHSPAGVHLELHFSLMDEKYYPEIASVLSAVWENAVPSEGSDFRLEMRLPFAYFYHITHMVKHYLYGGCGIRTLMDLWIFNHCIPGFDRAEASGWLTDTGIAVFGEKVYQLSEIWFSGADYEADSMELFRQMEAYILAGGIYGSVENKVKLNRLKNPNMGSYLFSRLFPPFERMKYEYSVLQKHKILLPFCHVRRWFRLLSKGTARRVTGELKHNRKLTQDGQDAFRRMLTDIGLQEWSNV